MKIETIENGVSLKNFSNIDLDRIFGCGQCFRWGKINDTFKGVANGKSLALTEKNGEIIFYGTSASEFKNFWFDYFDLGTDYAAITSELSKIHPLLEKACALYPGIRILRQEPWETLCSFIISQNNNIPRIKKIIDCFCTIFGEKIGENYSFPSPEKTAALTETDLAPIKSGFRASYILDAARKTASKEINFEEIYSLGIDDARSMLMKIKGVGPKVADCVLLYGFHKLSAFPTDVWMKKVMNAFFPGETPKMFGRHAGIAQQYLYHYSRMNPEIFSR